MTRKERQAINRSEYNKQLKRVKAYIAYHEKKGEIVNINLPERPKNPTKKDIQRLARMTPKRLEKNLVIFDKETGEILGKPKKKKSVQKKSSKKSQKKKVQKPYITLPHVEETEEVTTTPKIPQPQYNDIPLVGLDLSRTIIDNVKDEIMKFPAKPCKELLQVLDGIEKEKGTEELANALMESGSFLEMLQRVGTLYKAVDEYTAIIYRNLRLSDEQIKSMSEALEESTSWE